MTTTKYTFNLLGPFIWAAIILLMVGVIPFTAVWVGAILILSNAEISVSWSR